MLTSSVVQAEFWPWDRGEGEKPPKVAPYELPTMAGDGLDFRAKPAPLVKAPSINADEIFKTVLRCFPATSKFKLDVKLRAAVRSHEVFDFGELEDSSLGRSYVGIVANMPLYSTSELDKSRTREYQRRKDVAKVVAKFVSAIAARNQAVRELALYRSLEARAAVRVKHGIVSASEQVGYLEKVAMAQTTLLAEEAKIMESRLLLAGMCVPAYQNKLSDWLVSLAQIPKKSHEVD